MKNMTILIFYGSLIFANHLNPMEKLKDISRETIVGFSIGYQTGLALLPGTLALPIVLATTIDDLSHRPVIFASSAVVGHIFGYATWAAGVYALKAYKPYSS